MTRIIWVVISVWLASVALFTCRLATQKEPPCPHDFPVEERTIHEWHEEPSDTLVSWIWSEPDQDSVIVRYHKDHSFMLKGLTRDGVYVDTVPEVDE